MRPAARQDADRGLAAALATRGEALALAESANGLRHGFDYVLAAEPV